MLTSIIVWLILLPFSIAGAIVFKAMSDENAIKLGQGMKHVEDFAEKVESAYEGK